MISNLLLASFILAVLYVGRPLLIPIALAALLTFLLAPLVTMLHRWLGQVGAVLVVVAMMFCVTGFIGWVVTRQAVDLVYRLPDYKENISAKLRSIELPQHGSLQRVTETVNELKRDVLDVIESGKSGLTGTVGTAEEGATPVEVVNGNEGKIEFLRGVLAPIFGTAGLVVLLLIFMLLRREDLRNRILRLVGRGRITASSRAMDEAGTNVARYLLMQLVVNVTYGIPVMIGLYFIGVPNAVLWGSLCTVLRFIPYVGPWIGALLPILMSLAVSPGWLAPILTISLFIVLELISNNIAEPVLYGSSTGVTPIALIIAALGWTWLWGPVGLVLATPITVCLVALGRHVPRLAFLSIILSDEEPLTPAEECYQRMQRSGDADEFDFVETYLKSHPVESLFESVLIPMVSASETDFHAELLDKDALDSVQLRIGSLIEEVDLRHRINHPELDRIAESEAAPGILCVPANARRDELAGEMVVSLLHRKGLAAASASATLVSGELLEWVGKAEADAICITAVAPTTIYHARYLCRKLRSRFIDLPLVIALWGIGGESEDIVGMLKECGASEVVRSVGDAASRLAAYANASPKKAKD